MGQEPTVADFMDKKFLTLSPGTSINKAIDLLMKNRLIAALVVDEKHNPIGILSEKDCLKIILHQSFSQLPSDDVANYMHTVPNTIPSTMSAIEAAELLVTHKSRRLPVVDDGKLVGQITRRDLLRGLHLKLFPQKQKRSK